MHLSSRRFVFCALAMLVTFALPAPAEAQTDVAVVDLDRVLREAALVKSIEERARSYGQAIQARVQQLQTDRQQLTKDLQELNPQSDRALEMRQQLILKNAEIEGLNAAYQRELMMISAEGRIRTLNAMKEAIAQIARDRNLKLVMQKSPPLPAGLPPTFDPANQTHERQLQEMIDRQLALYAAPEVDITSEVLVKMDETFRAGGGQMPAPTTRPTTRNADNGDANNAGGGNNP